MTLPQEIALTLRRRPLLLPMLLVSLALGATGLIGFTNDSPHFIRMAVWGTLVGHAFLLGLWASHGRKYWFFRMTVVATLLYLVVHAPFLSADVRGYYLTVLAYFAFGVFSASICLRLIVNRKQLRLVDVQFPMSQVLLAMTTACLLLTAARFSVFPNEPPRANTIEIFVACALVGGLGVLVPRALSKGWPAVIMCILLGCVIGAAYSRLKTNSLMSILGIAITFGTLAGWVSTWCVALSVQPDAKRRMAARRKRRSITGIDPPKLYVEPSDPAPEPAQTTRLDLDA